MLLSMCPTLIYVVGTTRGERAAALPTPTRTGKHDPQVLVPANAEAVLLFVMRGLACLLLPGLVSTTDHSIPFEVLPSRPPHRPG